MAVISVLHRNTIFFFFKNSCSICSAHIFKSKRSASLSLTCRVELAAALVCDAMQWLAKHCNSILSTGTDEPEPA